MARSMSEGRRIPAHPDDVREGLREATERRCAAEKARADAMLDIAAWIVAGYETDGMEGPVTIAEMSRLTGLTRQTIYDILEREGLR